MLKTKSNVWMEGRRRTLPRKKYIRVFGEKRVRAADKLAASMSLDEMLEASKILDMRFRGENATFAGSLKVKKYVNEVLRLNRSDAKKMQQNLTLHIVDKNKRTTNAEEAKRLYKAFMDEK